MARLKKEKNGLYRKNLIVGKKADGSYIRKSVYGKTIKELEQKIVEMTQQINHGIQVWENSMTFRELANIWFEQYNNEAGEHWKYCQENMIKRYLMPALGEMRIRDLRQLHLQTIISSLNKKGLSTSTMKKVKQIATQIMQVAVGSDLIMRNPFLEINVPKNDPVERRPLTEKEIALITDNWRGHNLGPMAMIMLFCGLRRGEAIALEWMDIDFEKKLIHVTKAASVVKNKTNIKKPKSDAGVRDVPVPKVLLKMLLEIRKPSGFVCTNTSGGMLTESSFKRQWDSFRSYLNVCAGGRKGTGRYVPRITVIDNNTAHMLRHTYASMLFDANVDVKSAQKFLGHADIEVTLEIYTHLSEMKEERSIKALDKHLDEMIESKRYSSAKESNNEATPQAHIVSLPA